HVLDGDHGLISESLEQLDLCRREGTYLSATRGQGSKEFPLLTKRNEQIGARATYIHDLKVVLLADVRNVKRAVLAHPTIPRFINTHLETVSGNGYGTKMSPHNHSVAFTESQRRIIDSTNPSRALDDSVEDRLHVRGGAANNAEHLGRRRLMLQGLSQFRIAL